MKRNYLVGIALFLIGFLFFSAFGDSMYYCSNPREKVVTMGDSIVFLSHKKKERVISVQLSDERCLESFKTYDKGGEIVTIYEMENYHYEKEVEKFCIFKMDRSRKFFYYGFGYHRSAKSFEKAYQKPATPENIESINWNPELVPYLPKKKNSSYISHAFLRDRLSCRKTNYLEYPFLLGLLLLVNMPTP